MSKTIGKILTVAAIAVSVIAAIPTAGTSLGLSAGLLTAVGAGLAAASLINNTLLASKARDQLQARQASVVSLQLGEVAREVAFGTVMTGGSLVDAFNYGGTYGTDWECLVIALADHECDSLVGFYVNDTYVAFAGNGAVSGYNGQLEVYWQPGTMTQSVPSILTTNGPGWTANDKGAGVSYVVVAYRADKADAKNPIWTAGRPSFAWVLKGKKCYQARLDSSVGGSGSHRWSDPTTWAWTDNLIDCRYNWVRGVYAGNQVDQPGMLLVGRGLTDVEAPPANVFAPAAVCDEAVTLDAGGSEKRYRVNGVIRADETYIDVEEHFAAACGGLIHQPEGAVEIEPGQAKSAVFFFSDDDLIVGSTVEFSDDLAETDTGWVNTVVPRYIEPSQKYAEHAAPIRRVAADLIADGGPREQSLSLALVTSSTQAGRVGEIARRLGRLLRRGKVTLGPGFAEVEEGDWGVWTSQRYLNGASVTFRVELYSLDEKWQNTLVLREIDSSCYARDSDAAANTTAVRQAVPSIGAPGAAAWSVAAAALSGSGDSMPALVVTGATDNSFAELVRFEYLPSAGIADATAAAASTAWREDGTAGPDVKRREITSVAPNTGYYVGVSYIVGRVPGVRRVIGPVTSGGVSTAQAAAAATTATWSGTVNDGGKPENFATSADNMIVNGSVAVDASGWTLAGAVWVAAGAGDPSPGELQFPSGSTNRTAYANGAVPIQLNGATRLYVSGRSYHDTGYSGAVLARFAWYKADASLSATPYSVYSTAQTPGSWQPYSFAVDVPSDATSCIFYLERGAGTNFGYATATRLAKTEPAADVTPPLVSGPSVSAFSYDYTGSAKSGQLPADIVFKARTAAGVDITTASAWAAALKTGSAAFTIGVATGVLNVTAIATNATIEVTATYLGKGGKVTTSLQRVDDPAPAGSSGGSGGGTSDSTTSIANAVGNTYGAANTRVLTATAGSSGIVTLSFPASFYLSANSSDPAYGKWQKSAAGAGAWSDVASEIASNPDAVKSGGVDPTNDPGSINVAMSATGLTTGTSYDFRLLLRGGLSTRTLYFDGTASAVGS